MEYDFIKKGDCLQLMQELPDGSIDLILCDLPYGTTKCKWDTLIPLETLWEQYKRILKDNGAVVLFSQQPFTSALIASNYKMFRYEWIWQKSTATGFLNAKKMPLKKHENIVVFYKALPTYNPQFTPGEPYKRTRNGSTSVYGEHMIRTNTSSDGKRYPVDILNFKNAVNKNVHPTQKPIELLEYLIKTYTHPGDVVLDNAMGSGSTCVAAINSGRHYIGYELDAEYYEIAKQRIEDANLQRVLDWTE